MQEKLSSVVNDFEEKMHTLKFELLNLERSLQFLDSTVPAEDNVEVHLLIAMHINKLKVELEVIEGNIRNIYAASFSNQVENNKH